LAHYNPEQAHYRGMAAAYASGSAVTAGIYNRGTTSGRLQYEDAQRQLPYRQATAKAERDMAASTAQRLAAQKELNRLEGTENQLRSKLVQVEKELGEGGSGVDRQVLHETHKVITSQLEGYNSQVRQAKQAVVSAIRGESQAGGELGKAKMREKLLGQADMLQSRGMEQQATAGRLGGMDPLNRQQAFDAMKMLKDNPNNFDAMPPELKALAQQAFPAEFATIQEETGRKSSVNAQATAAGFRGAGDYVKTFKEEDTLRQQAGKEEYGIESKTSRELEKAGADLGDVIVKAMLRGLSTAQSKVKNTFLEGRNAGGG